MHRYGNQQDRTLGLTNLRSYKGEVRWVNGSTFGFLKDELDNHPAAWTRIWSTFLSATIRAWPVLRKADVRAEHFFDQYQLFEQSYQLNGWQQFIMETATSAAQKTLPAAQFGALFHPQVMPHSSSQRKWQASPRWMDESQFTSRKGGLTCYEKMIVVPNDRQYFQDRNDAQYFRNEALQRMNIPSYRQTPCKRKILRVLLLQRDRPLWNEAAVIECMVASGAANIVIDSVDESVPYYNQVELFYKADIIVSVHGSHLQNQHFMQPHTHIIEIFPKNYYHSEQLNLAHWTSVNIAQLTNSTFPSEKTVDAVKNPHLSKAYHKCLKQYEVFPGAEQCMAHKRCYDPCRSLGAQANMEEFKEAFEHAVSALTNAPHCK